jgi:hypothetical protein
MATYYFEGYPIVAPFSIESIRVILNSETATGKIFRRVGEGQRWDLSFGVITNNPEDLFISMLSNITTTNSMVMPQMKTVDDLLTGIGGYPTTVITASVGTVSCVINTVGLASYSGNKVIPKGAFIQFANHNKIYVVTSEVVEGTNTTVNFFPPLQANVSSSTAVKLPNTPQKPTLEYKRSVDQVSGISYSDGILVNAGTITLQEVV